MRLPTIPTKLSNWAFAKRGRQAKLARATGVAGSVVNDWVSGKANVPPGRCVSVERFTGISRKDLRPDDWQNYWPELEPLAPQVPETPFEVKKEATQNIAYSTQPELALEIPETSNTNDGTAQVAIKIIVQETVCRPAAM